MILLLARKRRVGFATQASAALQRAGYSFEVVSTRGVPSP
jgi:hypothetical protein